MPLDIRRRFSSFSPDTTYVELSVYFSPETATEALEQLHAALDRLFLAILPPPAED